MNVDGSDVRRLTFQGNYNQEPAWSPKGDLIAFSGRDEHRVFDALLDDVVARRERQPPRRALRLRHLGNRAPLPVEDDVDTFVRGTEEQAAARG